jgi:hypothetical protein
MKKLIIIALAGTIALTSCNKLPDDVLGLLEIQFTGQVLQVATLNGVPAPKTLNSVWGANDRIGIYMIKAVPGTLEEEYILVGNRQLAATGGATTSFYAVEGGPMFFPENPNESVKFLAYRPFSADITADFMLPINLTDQSDLSKLEILYVPATESFNRTRAEAIPLEFVPQLTKLVFQITNGTGVSRPVEYGLEVRILGQRTQGEFDLTNGAISASDELSEIIVQSAGEGTIVTAEAVVFPGSATGIQLLITNDAGQEFTVNLPSQTWANSTLYTYSITLTTVLSAPLVATLIDSHINILKIENVRAWRAAPHNI